MNAFIFWLTIAVISGGAYFGYWLTQAGGIFWVLGGYFIAWMVIIAILTVKDRCKEKRGV